MECETELLYPVDISWILFSSGLDFHLIIQYFMLISFPFSIQLHHQILKLTREILALIIDPNKSKEKGTKCFLAYQPFQKQTWFQNDRLCQ